MNIGRFNQLDILSLDLDQYYLLLRFANLKKQLVGFMFMGFILNFDGTVVFYHCREDINMTVRLVVNCRGMKINSVRE